MGGATLSLSTNAFPEGELAGCLEWAARLGLAGVEVGPLHAQPLAGSDAALASARADLDRLGIRPLSVHDFKGNRPADLGGICGLAERLGAGLIVTHCAHQLIVEDFDGQVGMLAKWDDWCRRRSIILAVENSSIQPLEPFARLFRALPGLSMTLDVKHAHKPEKLGLTWVDYFEALGDRAANFHVSGVDRSREELGDGCPPGNDAVDWDLLARTLAGRGYSGLITMELIFPRHLSPEERDRAYHDLPPPEPGGASISHRLARRGADFFREKLAPTLAG